MSSLFKSNYDVIVPQGIMLADISKVIAVDSFFVVKGKAVEGEVHLFDKKGNYLETILKRGNGPDESVNIWAMKVYGNDVFLLVNTGMEIMRYSISERKVIDKFRLPKDVVCIADFEIFADEQFIFYKNLTGGLSDECKLYMYDRKKNEIVDSWLQLQSESTEYISFSQSDCLYRRNGKIYFYEVFQKGIYELSEDGLNGYISFCDNQYMMPDNELYRNYTFNSFIDFCMKSPYIWAHRDIYESDHYIMSNYMFKNDYYWNVIDKRQGTSNSYSMIDDDVFFDEKMSVDDFPIHTNVQDSVRYFIVSYTQLSDVLRKKEERSSLSEFYAKHVYLNEILKKMNEDSNDLIVMLYEKQ